MIKKTTMHQEIEYRQSIGELIDDYAKSGIVLIRKTDKSNQLIERAKKIVNKYFPSPWATYSAMPDHVFHKIIDSAQDSIRGISFSQELILSDCNTFMNITNAYRLAVQGGLYLRVVRPGAAQDQDVVNFHRESFFNPDMRHSWKVWVPLSQSTEQNALQFVPSSQLIDESEIRYRNTGQRNSPVKKFSSGHKIGLLYDDIEIIHGVDLRNAKAMIVPEGYYAVFNSNLIHGSGKNSGCGLRISIDFSIIPSECITKNPDHFSTGEKFYSELRTDARGDYIFD